MVLSVISLGGNLGPVARIMNLALMRLEGNAVKAARCQRLCPSTLKLHAHSDEMCSSYALPTVFSICKPSVFLHTLCPSQRPPRSIRVLRTSFMYQTPPMYVFSQPPFLNAAALIRTTLSPQDLLASLKAEEVAAGRDMNARRWHERAFVLVPLCDILQQHGDQFDDEVKETGLESQVQQHLAHVARDANTVKQAWALSADKVHVLESRSILMGILNVTPDSFSDGGHFIAKDEAVARAIRMLQDGADIIDVGGQSTRPGAAFISPAEEMARVVPIIRELSKLNCIVSVDTFRAEVARAAVHSGAQIVNDVSGGRADPDMLRTVADLGVSYILMHSRGQPGSMHDQEHLQYGTVERDVAHELHQMCSRALRAGVRLWQIMIDPGIGFSKSSSENFKLLANLDKLKSHMPGPLASLPVLIGASRKRFLGTLIGQETASERDFASASAAALAVGAGANAIRVHNVRAGYDSARVSDAIVQARQVKCS